jgi:zinc protease
MSRSLFIAGALCCLVSTQSVRAASTSSPLDVLRESNRSLRRFELPNGMVGLVKEDRSAPAVAIQIWVGTGAIHEEAYLGAGLSHYMEHMIFKGTPTRGPADISRQIDEAGGDINAYTAQDRTVFHCELPSKNWKVGVDVLSDAVMNASLPEDEWEREKEVILREFAMGYDDPDRVLNKLLWRTAYRVHPYRFPVIGYEEVFRTMTRDNLEEFFKRHYVPDNMIVSIAGDVDANEVEAYVRDAFKGFTRKARAPVIVPQEPPQITPRSGRETGPFNITRMQWCYHTVPLSSPDAPALDLLANIVGQGRSSRLADKIKEKHHLVHEIDAWSYTLKDPGLFGISAVMDPEKEDLAIRAIQKEVDSWSEKPFTREELEKAKRGMLVGELSGLQTMSGQASSYASGEFYAGNPLYGETYLATLEKITSKDLQEVARRYLRPENRTLAILAPAATNADDAVTAKAGAELNVQKVVLDNGIPLIVRQDHRLPFVYFTAALGGGLLSENATNNGVTQLMTDLFTRGTESYTTEEIARKIEQLGASMSSFAGRNSFGLQAQCLSQDADAVADLFAQCLLRPVFPEEELAKQREIQIAGILQQYEQPMFVAQEKLRAELYPGHPYRFNTAGTVESVKALTRDDVTAQFKKHVVAGNIALAIFGDVTVAEAKALAEKHFGDVPRGSMPQRSLGATQPALPARVVTRDRKAQAILLVGFPGVDIDDPRQDALNLLQRTMSGLSSDLGIEVREKRGLVYYVGSFNQVGVDPGMFVCYAGTRGEAVEEVEKLIGQEIDRVTEDGLRENELNRAREQMLSDHDKGLQDNLSLSQMCALNELYGLGYEYTFSLPQRVNALTREAVRAAAADILKEGRQAVSILLPEDKKTEEQP